MPPSTFCIGCGAVPFVGEAGAFTFIVKSSPTSVPLEAAGRFHLENNYPNPFNPSTTVRFEVPASGIVTLKVLDVLGREVSTLVERVLEAGSHTAVFDASRFSSGVYFYSLEWAGRKISKPMLLLK